MWFLNCRSAAVGGDVSAVKVTDGTLTYLNPSAFLQEVRGLHVLIGVHGFNVHQVGAVEHLQEWASLLDLGSGAVFVGALWPGDSAWLGALEYPFAAKTAMQAGQSLANFLNSNLAGAASISFVSHSLGARVAFSAIQALTPHLTVRRLVLMAGAVDDTCLTEEFAAAASKVVDVSILTSQCDDVLKLAFPLGNPLSGIFAQGHPYWRGALGREGPASLPVPNNIHAAWRLPDAWRVGHEDYLPPDRPFPVGYAPVPYTVPLDLPSPMASRPPLNTPEAFSVQGEYRNWQSAWTAAFTSSRFR